MPTVIENSLKILWRKKNQGTRAGGRGREAQGAAGPSALALRPLPWLHPGSSWARSRTPPGAMALLASRGPGGRGEGPRSFLRDRLGDELGWVWGPISERWSCSHPRRLLRPVSWILVREPGLVEAWRPAQRSACSLRGGPGRWERGIVSSSLPRPTDTCLAPAVPQEAVLLAGVAHRQEEPPNPDPGQRGEAVGWTSPRRRAAPLRSAAALMLFLG